MPTSAITALQALRDIAHVQPGHTVLVTGASGGVGTFAVQIAKALGAEVTGVCSTRNVELVRSVGADHVIDYTRTDFTQTGRRYDVILDNVEAQPLSGGPTGAHTHRHAHPQQRPRRTLGRTRWAGSSRRACDRCSPARPCGRSLQSGKRRTC